MLGIIDPDGYEKVNRVYGTHGDCPTITARDYKDPIKTSKNTTLRTDRCLVIGQMDNTLDHSFESANRVYSAMGLAPTISTCAGGNIKPKVLVRK